MKHSFNDQKSFISYNDFSGGMNVDVGEDNFSPKESSKAINVDISSRGPVETRPGIVALNSASYNSDVRKYYEWRKKDGTVSAVAVFRHNDDQSLTLEKIDRSTGVNTTIAEIEDDDFDFEVFNDMLLFIVGGKYRYYDGNLLHDIRQVQPTGTMTIQETRWVQQYDEQNHPIGEKPSGVRNGFFKFMFTTVNSLGSESPASNISSFTATDAEQFTISNIPLGDSETVSRNIYRTKAGGSVFYLIKSIPDDTLPDNTTTSFVDTSLDSELSTQFNSANSHTNLLKCKFLKRHPYSMRFFAAGNPDDVSALYVSEPNEPWNWKEYLVYYPNSGTGGRILDIRMSEKYVIVFYESGPYTWHGVDPDTDVMWGPLAVFQSPAGERLACLTSNTLTLANQSGFHALNPSLFSSSNIVVQSGEEYVFNLAQEKFSNEFKKITDFANARMIFDWVDQKLLLYCDDGTGNDRVIVYFWKEKAFTMYTGWKVNEWFQSYNGSLMFASENYIYITKRGLTDNGAVIPFEFETGNLDLGVAKIFKIISKLFVYCQLSNGNTEINISIFSDSDSQDLDPIQLYSGTLWTSLFKWDSTSRWGQKSMVTKERRTRVKGLKFKVNIKNNNLGEKVILNSLGFRFKTTKPKGERN